MVVKLQLLEISSLDKEVLNTIREKTFTWVKIIPYMQKLTELLNSRKKEKTNHLFQFFL